VVIRKSRFARRLDPTVGHGAARVERHGPHHAQEHIYQEVRAGGILGEIAIVDEGAPRSASAVATTYAEPIKVNAGHKKAPQGCRTREGLSGL
jgi:cyclic nucleotide-binding protein